MKKYVCVSVRVLFLLMSVPIPRISNYGDEHNIKHIIMTINEEQLRDYIHTLQDIGPRVTESPEQHLMLLWLH